jgi:hypothetical protein
MHIPKLLVLGAVLVSACNGGRPMCGPGEILATDSFRQLFCIPAPQGDVPPPQCNMALTSDGRTLSCTSRNTSTDRDQDVPAALMQLATTLTDLQTALPEAPGMPAVRYLGVSTYVTPGAAVSPTNYNKQGLAAAAELCARDYGEGAHACLMDELYTSATAGTPGEADTIPLAWVYMPNWNYPISFYFQPEEGLADNCNGLDYGGTDRGWRGILVQWGPLPSGDVGFRWHGGADALCLNMHPLACCR